MPRERQRDTWSPTVAEAIANESFEVFEATDAKTGKYKFKLKIIDLKSRHSFPPPSIVKISIRKGTGTLEIREWDTIANISDGDDFDFEVELPAGKTNVTCRLCLVSASGPEYLGFSNWRHTRDATSNPLFKLRLADLGNQLWEYNNDDNEYLAPIVYLNDKVNGLQQALMGENILIMGMMFPNVIRLGFSEIIFGEKPFEGIELDGTWTKMWWEFAKVINEKAIDLPESNPTDAEKNHFLDELVDASVSRFNFVDGVSSYLEDSDEEDV